MTAPKITMGIEPQQGGSVQVLPLAPNQAGEQMAQLSLVVQLNNQESSAVTVDTATLTFTQPKAGDVALTVGLSVPAKGSASWRFGVADNVLLDWPTPSVMTISLQCSGYSEPAVAVVALADHVHPNGGFRFPALASELGAKELWAARSAVHAPDGTGGQLFGYDMDILGFDEELGTWSRRATSGATGPGANEDYRIWGKSVVAMADGTVVAFDNTQATNPDPPSPDLSPPNPVEGNHFYIQHGDALVLYAHLQGSTMNADLMTVGASVAVGDVLGLAGNSGNSTHPHLHIHAIRATAPWSGPPWPLPFDDETSVVPQVKVDHANIAAAPWSLASGRGPAADASFVYPGQKAPIGGRRPIFNEVAIDPLSLILRNDIYVKINLPYPPPIEVLLQAIRREAAGMTREARGDLARRVGALADAYAAVSDELAGSLPEHSRAVRLVEEHPELAAARGKPAGMSFHGAKGGR